MIGGPFANQMPIDERRPSPNPGPGMNQRQYTQLVARGEKQLVTDEDVARLQAKVRRIRSRG